MYIPACFETYVPDTDFSKIYAFFVKVEQKQTNLDNDFIKFL